MKKKPKINPERHTEPATACIQDASSRNKNLNWLSASFIAFITFLVYLPALQNGFVNWDDNLYVYENQNIGSLDFQFLKWSLSAVVASLWHPLTMFSLALDNAIWGLNPSGFHFTNITVHAINTFLVFIVVIQLIEYGNVKGPKSRTLIVGTATALLFGIHPLHVESVVWISERKDVLSAFFFLSSIFAYIKYAATKRRIFYSVSLMSFIMALMSKPMAVSLPLVLLILDFYPLKRYESGTKYPITEKLPFFALSIFTSLLTIWAHVSDGGIKTLGEFPLTTRIFVAGRAVVFYLFKMILPLNLAPYYPYPKGIHPFELEYIAAFALLAIIIIWSLRKGRLFFAVLLYYIATLIPVLGIMQVGAQAAADRYTYLPSLGPFLLIGLGVGTVFERYSGWPRKALIISLSLLTVLLINMTLSQIALWKDSITLWSHEIRLFPNTAEIAYHNRGDAYVKSGRHQEAISDYNMAVEIEPRYVEVYYSRGTAYMNLGNYMQAITDYNTAIKLNPEHINAYYNRGNAHKKLGMYQEAISDYSMTIKISPKYVEAYNNRGNVYYELRDATQAIRDYNASLKINPRNVEAYINLGNMYNVMGDFQEAIGNYTKAIELNPRYASAYNGRSLAYSNLKDHQQAIKDSSAAIGLDPKSSIAYKLRGVSYGNIGNFQQALLDIRMAVELNPQDTEAQHYLTLAKDKENIEKP